MNDLIIDFYSKMTWNHVLLFFPLPFSHIASCPEQLSTKVSIMSMYFLSIMCYVLALAKHSNRNQKHSYD